MTCFAGKKQVMYYEILIVEVEAGGFIPCPIGFSKGRTPFMASLWVWDVILKMQSGGIPNT